MDINNFTYNEISFLAFGEAQQIKRQIDKVVAERKGENNMSEPRQNAMVKFILPSPEYELYFKPLMEERCLIYLGEIPNMQGHCVVAGQSGKVYMGYHVEDFVELTEDEV